MNSTNPGMQDYTFDLAKLIPGKMYRRIKGTEFQDTTVNNGKDVPGILTLTGHDALFLIKK